MLVGAYVGLKRCLETHTNEDEKLDQIWGLEPEYFAAEERDQESDEIPSVGVNKGLVVRVTAAKFFNIGPNLSEI